MARFYAFREDRLGFYYQLGERTLLGRAPECDLILSDRGASRRHAEVIKNEAGYFLTDLSSTNGTLVNSRPAVGQVLLTPNATIEIGQEIFIFEPGLEILVGPAGPVMIIDNLPLEAGEFLKLPLEGASADLALEDSRRLLGFLRGLPAALDLNSLLDHVAQSFKQFFGALQVGILWPTAGKNQRLSSFWAHPARKYSLMPRELLALALNGRQAAFWPRGLRRVSFSKGRRKLEPGPWKTALLPLPGQGGSAQGLLYLRLTKNLSLEDLNFLAALGAALAPQLAAAVTLRQWERRLNLLSDYYDYNTVNAPSSEEIEIIKAAAGQAAQSEARVCITGEMGTGKTSLARYIHSQSDYRDGPFIVANLSLIPPLAQEAAIFGQVVGRTAEADLTGLFEMADGGTLFLKNLEYLAADAQKALLMALEEKIFFPLGADKPRTAEARLISSSAEDLWSLVQAGLLREDLYLRLNQVNLTLPPLREAKIDLGRLAAKLMDSAAQRFGLPFTGLDSAAAECLKAYPWPGNIAELKAVTNILLLSSRRGGVSVEDLPGYLKFAPEAFRLDFDDSPLVEETERYFIVRALARTYGRVEAAAGMINLAPEVMIPIMRRLNIDPTVYRKESHFGASAATAPGRTETDLA